MSDPKKYKLVLSAQIIAEDKGDVALEPIRLQMYKALLAYGDNNYLFRNLAVELQEVE